MRRQGGEGEVGRRKKGGEREVGRREKNGGGLGGRRKAEEGVEMGRREEGGGGGRYGREEGSGGGRREGRTWDGEGRGEEIPEEEKGVSGQKGGGSCCLALFKGLLGELERLCASKTIDIEAKGALTRGRGQG